MQEVHRLLASELQSFKASSSSGSGSGFVTVVTVIVSMKLGHWGEPRRLAESRAENVSEAACVWLCKRRVCLASAGFQLELADL